MEALQPEKWDDFFLSIGRNIATSFSKAVPLLLAAIVGLLVAWLVSRALAWLAARGLRRLGFDRAAERLSVTSVLRRAGSDREPSALAGQLVFWVMFSTIIASIVGALGVDAVGEIAARIVTWVPRLAAATLIVFAGLFLGRLARNLVHADPAVPSRIGRVLQAGTVVVSVVVALEQLGIDTDLLVLVITVVVGATGATMGIAFALGARPVITHILAGHFLRQTLVPGASVDVAGHHGQLERVGPVATTFRDGDRAFSIPNARLMDEIVER